MIQLSLLDVDLGAGVFPLNASAWSLFGEISDPCAKNPKLVFSFLFYPPLKKK